MELYGYLHAWTPLSRPDSLKKETAFLPTRSRRQAQVFQDAGKSFIRAQVVHRRIESDPKNNRIPFVHGFAQPFDCRVALAERRVDSRHCQRTAVPALCKDF